MWNENYVALYPTLVDFQDNASDDDDENVPFQSSDAVAMIGQLNEHAYQKHQVYVPQDGQGEVDFFEKFEQLPVERCY